MRAGARLLIAGLSIAAAVALAAVLRGSYHLYQGFGAFLGNAAMGVLFGRLYQRWGRTMPMIIAHASPLPRLHSSQGNR